MKILIILALFFRSVMAYAQEYSFAKDFVTGSIILKDSTKKSGWIKWYPDPVEKLKFRENENGKTVKFAPGELSGFQVDSLNFVSLFNFEVYAAQYDNPYRCSHMKWLRSCFLFVLG